MIAGVGPIARGIAADLAADVLRELLAEGSDRPTS
jgi:hypothetical protein